MEKVTIAIPEVRAAIDLIYGPFGGGKNTLAAILAKDALLDGIPVFSSFPVKFEGQDDVDSKWKVFLGLIGWKKIFKVVPKENFYRLTMKEISEESFVQKLFHMQKCVVIIDEGYAARLLDSYRKTNVSVDARIAVYTTRHFDRRFIIVAQRPNAIHVSSRAMVNRFFRASQPLGDNTIFSNFLWRITAHRWFIFTEYQEMKDDTVDEDKPRRQHWVWASKQILNFFDSKYMSEGISNDYPSKAYGVKYKYKELFKKFTGRALQRTTDTALTPNPISPILPPRSIRKINVLSKT